MNYSKLLSRQVARYLPEEIRQLPEMTRFLDVVHDSYLALERDRAMLEQAFTISEEEYKQLHDQLKHEIDVKKLSVKNLKEAVNTINGVENQPLSDDLLAIARLLNQQVNQRKNAEQVFTSLIANMQSGVLLEDEHRKIAFTNQVFCDLFAIPASPDQLQGMDCSTSADETKDLFKNPDLFVSRIHTILTQKQLVRGEILERVNGDLYQRDYIPIYIDDKYKGHLWSYTNITEQKKSQYAIEQSELKNRLIMNGALDAIITIDLTGLITFWNPQAEKVFGWTSEEVIGQKLSDIIIPVANRMHHERGMKQYTETRTGPVLGKQMELLAMNRNKKTFPIELYIIPVKQGESEFFCSFIRDISERKANEAELERLSLVASANKNGIVFVGLDGKIFWSNEGFSKLTQYSSADCKGKTPFELCKGPYSDRESLKTMVAAFEKGQAFDVEGIHYKQDGTWFWGRTNGQPVVNKQGILTHYFSMVEDISAEKVVQRQLKEYEERLRMALTNVGDNYWEHDFRTNKTYYSNLHNNLLGFQVDKTVNVADLWWRQVHAEDKHTLEENNKNYKAGLLHQHANEYRMIHQDGSIHWVLDRGVVTEQDEDGKPLKIIGTHIDITRQKELEFDLTSAKEAAEESTKAKELFLANMSHEIRTPMNAIMGMANQLRKTPLDASQQFYLSTIQSATDNLLIIINDILDLSKIKAGSLTLEKIGFEPQQVVKRAMQVMLHRAEEKGLLFTNSFCDSRLSPVLIGDPYRLNQILLNLISNAVKFTDKGSVDISCRVIEEDAAQQTIEATVKDTGIGMEEAFVKDLFRKFSQEDESISRRFGGTGLGMSICENLVGLMGGTLQVQSKKGVGTSITFTISFRKGGQDDLPVKETGQVNTDILSGKRILVVDDNEMNRLVASTILKSYGTLVDEAQNGAEAVEKLKHYPYDLVLMDVQMPVMDGLEATRQIRTRMGDQLPIIALTAFAVTGDRERFMATGMSDYLSKPFSETQLLSVVAKWLSKTDSFLREDELLPSHKPVEVAVPLFDLSGLYAIGKGNEIFVSKMVELFVDQAPASVQEIKAAYVANDFEKVRKVAHSIKPSLESFGITSLREVILEIEKKAEVYQTSQRLENLIHTLDSTLTQVLSGLSINGIAQSAR